MLLHRNLLSRLHTLCRCLPTYVLSTVQRRFPGSPFPLNVFESVYVEPTAPLVMNGQPDEWLGREEVALQGTAVGGDGVAVELDDMVQVGDLAYASVKLPHHLEKEAKLLSAELTGEFSLRQWSKMQYDVGVLL